MYIVVVSSAAMLSVWGKDKDGVSLHVKGERGREGEVD